MTEYLALMRRAFPMNEETLPPAPLLRAVDLRCDMRFLGVDLANGPDRNVVTVYRDGEIVEPNG